MRAIRCLLILGFMIWGSQVFANPPKELDYQCKILVNSSPFTGTGYFKFALANDSNTTNFWALDGSTTGEPGACMTGSVYNGVFSTSLGRFPMPPVPPEIFARGTSLFLRVWFGTTNTTFDELLPAQKMLSAGFALNADLLDGMHAAAIIAAATNALSETDPIWNAQKSGYATGTPLYAYTETDPVWTTASNGYYLKTEADALFATGTPLYAYTEADPIWTAASNEYYQKTEADSRFVDVAGDTMTGALTINVGAQNALVLSSAGNAIQIGNTANGDAMGTAVGYSAVATNQGVAAGYNANGAEYGTALGYSAAAQNSGAAVGYQAQAAMHGAAIGANANAYNYGIAIGEGANAYDVGVAVGFGAAGYSNGLAMGTSACGVDNGVAVGASAQAIDSGVAVGAAVQALHRGAAVGMGAKASTNGAAVGISANGEQNGAVVGAYANAWDQGSAIGLYANASGLGAGIGSYAMAFDNGAAVGTRSQGLGSGVGLGFEANGAMTNIAIGVQANSLGGSERIAIGHAVTNDVDESARIRGMLYMDGGATLMARATFGSGPWTQLLPLQNLDNVLWVATNGTPTGPGSIDRPFAQPQAAYNAAATLFAGQPAAIVIAAGSYRSLNMSAGHINVVGIGRPVLQSLTVSASGFAGQRPQRVESIMVTQLVAVVAGGGGVKFHNCRMLDSLRIVGDYVELQDCYVRAMVATAVEVGDPAGLLPVNYVAIYNSSIENTSPGNATLVVHPSVDNFEVLGCQLANNSALFTVIEDQQVMAIAPLHLYSHNVINGPAPAPGVYALTDMAADPTIVFTHNTVRGHVGSSGSFQFYANNSVYGLINQVGGVGPGWRQAGTGTGPDAAGNVEHETNYPLLPASWDD